MTSILDTYFKEKVRHCTNDFRKKDQGGLSEEETFNLRSES